MTPRMKSYALIGRVRYECERTPSNRAIQQNRRLMFWERKTGRDDVRPEFYSSTLTAHTSCQLNNLCNRVWKSR
jgi:hypothetical protein